MIAGCINPEKSKVIPPVPNNDLRIELPSDLLTAGDLVGRAVRIGRANWLALGRFFLAPTAVYWLAIPCAFWDPDTYTNEFSPAANLWIWVLGFLFIFLAIWDLSVRKFALIYYLAGISDSVEEGLKKAQKKMWPILLVTLPVLLFEVCENVLSIISTKLGALSGGVTDALAFWELWLTALEFVLLLPFLWVIMLNAYYIAFIVFEESSIAKAAGRFWSLSMQDGMYVALSLTLMSLVYFCAGGPIIAVLALEILLPKEALWYFLGGIGSAVLAGPLDAFMTAVITVCGALLYQQVCARREGRDLLKKLQLLEVK